MAGSLLDFVNNLAERAGKITCKYGHDDKNVKLVELNTMIAILFLNT